MIGYATLDSFLGPILVEGGPEGLTRIEILESDSATGPTPEAAHDPRALSTAVEQLTAYLNGDLRTFDLVLAPRGTDFQRRVWQALTTIPYGETWSYGQLAGAIGRSTAARAVGAANGRNPLPIVVPCHRVIGAGGALTGFRGGIRFKRALLHHEAGGQLPMLSNTAWSSDRVS